MRHSPSGHPRTAFPPVRPGSGACLVRRAGQALVAAVAVAACGPAGDAPGGGPAVSVRDSAGVRIVEYPGEVPEDRVVRVTGEPALVIGREGDEAYELFRAVGVAVLSDGRIVVGNAGSGSLSYYGPDGVFQARAGQLGDGPREFGSVGEIGRSAEDTLYVIDGRRRRLVLVSPAPSVVEGLSWADDVASSPERLCGPPVALGVIARQKVFFESLCFDLEGRPGAREVAGEVLLDGPDGTVRLGEHAAFGIWERESDDGRPNWTIPPGLPRARWHVGPGGIHIAAGADPEVRSFDRFGTLERVTREALMRPMLADVASEGLDSIWEEAGVQDLPDDLALPAYDAVLASAEGDLWLRRFVLPEDSVQRWVVLPRAASPTRHVLLPADVELHAVRDGRLYGLRTDELGIQQVVVHDLGEAW